MADTNFPASPNPSDIEDPEEDSISQPPVTAPEEPEADAPATPTAESADVAEQELVRPPVKKYSEWLTGEITTPLDAFEGLNQKESATAAQISNVKRYVDYWRNELLDRGKYEGAKTEKFLSDEFNQAFKEIGIVQLEEGEEFDVEKVNAAVAEASITPGKDSVKKRLELIATLDDTTIQRIGLLTGEDEIAESIRARADFLLKSNPQTDSEREVYAESVNSVLDEVKTNLDEVGVRQNKIPFAKVIKVDEGPSIISSAKAIEEAGGLGPAISQSIRDGYLDPEDAADVYRKYGKVDEKSKLNRAQIANASEIRSVIPNVVNRIEDNDMLENALKEAAGSFNKWEELDSITEQAESGPPLIEDSEELRKTQESRQRYYDLLAETINKSEVAPVGLKVDPTDKSFHAAADLYVQEMASQINPESFVVEGDLSKNIKQNPLTGDLYVHPASYLRPDIFEKSMDERGLNDMQKSILRTQRDTSLDRFSVGGIKFLATEDGTTWKEYIESQGGEEEIRNAYREELYEKRRAKVSSGEMTLEESANYYPDTEAKPIGSYVADFLTKAKPNEDFIYGMGMLGEVVHSPAYYVQSIPLLAGQVPGKIGESIRGTKMYESAENAAVSLARANMENRANIEALGYKPGFLYDLSVGAAGLVGQLATDFVLTRGLGGALKLGGAKALGMKGAKDTALKKVMGLVTSEKALAKATAAKGAERANYYKELLSNARRVIPGKKLTEAGGVAARASLASYSRNVGSSLAQIQDNPETAGLPLEQQREMAADIAAVRTGLEATLTAGFSFLGMDAVESLILKGASTGTVKKAMAQFAKVDNLSNKEFAAIAGKALREVEKDLGVSSNGLSKFILGTASEAVEEGLPESAGVIFEDFVFNYLEYDKLASEEPMQRLWDKYLTFSKYVIEGNIDGELALEALKSGGYEGAIGGILGGTISGGRSIGGAVRSRMGRSSEETVLAARKGQELVSQRISDKLTDSGSPITAEVVSNFLRSPARGKKFNGKTREEVEEMISSGTLTQEEAVAMGLAAPAPAPAPTAEATTTTAPAPTAETTTTPAEPAPTPTEEATTATAEATTTTEPAPTTTAETTTAPAETTTAPSEATTTEPAPTPTAEATTATAEPTTATAEATTAPEVVDDAPPVTTRLSAEEEIAIEEILQRVSEGDREAADDTTRLNSPTVAPDVKVETNTPDQNVERAASNFDAVSLIDKKLETPSTENIKTKTAGLADETARVAEAGGKVVYVEDIEAADKEIIRVNGGRGLTDFAKKSFSNSVDMHIVVDGKPVTFIFESKLKNKNAAGLRKILRRAARHAAITTAVGYGGIIQPSTDTAKNVSKKTPRYKDMTDAEKVLAVIELIEDGKITLDPKQDADFITYLRELAGKVGISNNTAGIDLSSIISKTVGEPILPPDSERTVQNMEQRMRNGRTVRRFNQKTVDDKARELGADGDKYRAFVSAIEEALSSIPSIIPIRLITGDNRYAAATQGRIEINLGLLFDLYNNILELDLTNKDDLKKVTAHLDRTINEELGHISSLNSIPEKLFQKVVKGMSDSDFEYIISTYYAYDSQGADNARAELRSGDPELVARTKEYLTEEFLRQAGQDRSGGFTTEDSMRLLVGGDEVRSNFRQVAIEYLKGMYRRITNKTRMGRILSGPERAALARMRNEMWYLSNEFTDPLPYGYSYSGTPTGPAADIEALSQMFPPQEPDNAQRWTPPTSNNRTVRKAFERQKKLIVALQNMGVRVESVKNVAAAEALLGRKLNRIPQGGRGFTTRIDGEPVIILLEDQIAKNPAGVDKLIMHEAIHAAHFKLRSQAPSLDDAALKEMMGNKRLARKMEGLYPGFKNLAPESQLAEVMVKMGEGKIRIGDTPNDLIGLIQRVIEFIKGNGLIEASPELEALANKVLAEINKATIGTADRKTPGRMKPRQGKTVGGPEVLGAPVITLEQDADYLAAVEAGDMETAQRMVDEAAKAAGESLAGNKLSGSAAWLTPSGKWIAAKLHGHHNAIPKGINGRSGFYKLGFIRATAIDGQLALEGAKMNALQKREARDTAIERGLEINDGTSFLDRSSVVAADPITYDADGNVIPLSQRFDEQKESILYAPRISNRDARDDADYMDAIDRGDYDMAEEALMRVGERYGVTDPELIFRDNDGNIMTPSQRFMTPPSVLTPEKIARHKELEAKYNAGTLTPEETAEAERIVAEAAKAAGYGVEGWHYTNADIDDVFDIGTARTQSDIQAFFFMDRPDPYREYGDKEFHVFLNTGNPTDYDTAYSGWRGDRDDSGILRREELQKQGFNSVIIPAGETGLEYGEIMIFSPSQIKSADPFTGVPIDERFDPGSESILYAPRFVDNVPGGNRIKTEVEVDIRPTLETLVAPIYHTNDVDLGNWMKRTVITGDIADERIRNMIISVNRFAKVIPDFMKEFESRMRKEIKKLGVMDDSVRDLFNTAVGTEDIIVDKDDINRINENLNRDLAIIRSTEPEKFRAPAEGEIDTIIAGIVSEDVSKQKGFTKEELQDKAKEKFRKKLEEEATEKANKERQKVFDDAAKKKKIEVAEALVKLEQEVPSLAQLVIDVRQAITDISEFAAEHLPLSEDMKIIFDSTQGFYLSRRYRFFNDPDYRSTLLEEVASDTVGQFHSQISDVIPIFKENLYKETRESVLKTEIRKRILSGELTIDQLKDESVIDELRIEIEPIVNEKIPDPDKSARAALQEYLESFGNRREQQYSEQGARFIDSVLKNKKDLPESFTKLLGKYDTESDPLGSFRVMLQTVGAQTAMLASAMKLQNLVDINDRIENVDGKFLLTKKEYDAKVEKGEISREDFKAWDQKGGSMSHSDPLKGMYVESGIYKGLTAKKNKIDMDTATQTDRGIHFGTGVIGFLTGMSMMAVTSVSGVGFHLRNTISNIYRAANTGQLFDPRFISTMLARTLAESALIVPFVPQKVRYIPDKIARMMKGERVSLDELMTEHFKLQSLSVVNQSMDAASLRNVFNPTEQKATDFYAKLEEFDNKSKLGRISRKALLGYFGYIQKLNNASDNAYRLTSYYRYKRLLEKAKESGKGGTFRGVEVSQMSPSQIEKEAALMMNKVTPGDDYLVQSARYITESNLRFIAAPFTRFRAEVFRTFVNSFKETYALFNSGNPALQREGAKRSAGLLALIGISFGPATSFLSKMFGGFDEEDQDILDEGNPDFFKTAQIIRQRKGDIIIDHNFTYMNENAMFGDAFTYAMQEMRMGKSGSEAAIKGLTRFVFHEVLGEQILAGVISDIRNNQDAGTKRAIVSDLDSGPEQFLKVSEYALNRLSPSSFRGIAEGFAAYEVTEGEALDKLESASKAFALRSVVPTKPFSKPIQDRMRDTLKRYGRMRTDNDYTKSKLASQFKSVSGKQRKYTDKEIEDIANEYMTKTVRIFDRVDRVVKGYRKMGVSDKKIYDELKDSFNMRQDHAKYYLDTGRFILPDFSKTQYEELNKYEDIEYANKKVGAFRDQLNKYVTKNPNKYRIYTPNAGAGD